MKSAIAPGCLLALCAGCNAMDIPQIDIHGFVSQGYLKSDDNNYLGRSEEGTYSFNEAAVNFSGDLTDKLRIGVCNSMNSAGAPAAPSCALR